MNVRYLLISEGLWWGLSFLIAAILVYPYYPDLIVEVPFLIPNVVMAIIMVHCLRHVFFFRQSLLGNSGWLIYLMCFTFVPVSIYVMNHFSRMALFFDTADWIHSFSYILTLTEKSRLANYIRAEFTFVAVTAFIGGILMSGRFVIASWRQINRRKAL